MERSRISRISSSVIKGRINDPSHQQFMRLFLEAAY